MDLLRNLFGTVTSGIVRLLVAVGIIAASYFFIIEPVLNQTDDVFDRAFQDTGLNEISRTIEDVNTEVQREIRKSFKVSRQRGNPQKLIRCIQRSNNDVQRIKRCTVKY